MPSPDIKTQLMKHPHWKGVNNVVEVLRQNGFKAYLAGGCVRDAILGRTPHDIDIATDAHPDRVEQLFSKTIAVGKQFGVIIVPFEGYSIEVVTFRSDGDYLDGRHPSGVVFSSPQEDAERRDFTINALFYDPVTSQVVDYVDGQKDLNLGLIRTVGQAEQRFTEDKLRILRAVRFSAQLGFAIEDLTRQAIVKMASQITQVSGERIYAELVKLVTAKERLRGLNLLVTTGLWQKILPEWNLPESEVQWSKAKLAFEKVGVNSWRSAVGILAAFHFPLWKERGVDLKQALDLFVAPLERLRSSREDIKVIKSIVSRFFEFSQSSWTLSKELPLSRAVELLAGDIGRELDHLVKLFLRLQGHQEAPWIALSDSVQKKLLPNGDLPPPWFAGEDLIAMGFSPGAEMGRLLKELYSGQIEERWSDPSAAKDWLVKQKNH